MRTVRAEIPALLTSHLYFCVGPSPLSIPTLLMQLHSTKMGKRSGYARPGNSFQTVVFVPMVTDNFI